MLRKENQNFALMHEDSWDGSRCCPFCGSGKVVLHGTVERVFREEGSSAMSISYNMQVYRRYSRIECRACGMTTQLVHPEVYSILEMFDSLESRDPEPPKHVC